MTTTSSLLIRRLKNRVKVDGKEFTALLSENVSSPKDWSKPSHPLKEYRQKYMMDRFMSRLGKEIRADGTLDLSRVTELGL